jgi:hypothetical protein
VDFSYIFISVADPGSGAFLTPGSGMGKKSRSGSGMNILDHHPGTATLLLFGLSNKVFDKNPFILRRRKACGLHMRMRFIVSFKLAPRVRDKLNLPAQVL